MAALRLAEGVAPGAVVAVAHGFHAGQRFGGHTLVEHPDGGAVLKARHDFGKVGEGRLEAAFGPRGHEQARFVAHDVGTHVVEVAAEVGHEVIAVNALQRSRHLVRVGQVAQSADVGHVLPHQLVDEAAAPQLECGDGRCGVVHVEWLERGGVADLLFEVFAVEKVLLRPRAALFVQLVARLGQRLVAHGAGHLAGGAQRAQIPEPHLRIRAEVVDVHGVVLAALHHAVAVTVPPFVAPGVGQYLFGLLPMAFEKGTVARELPVAVELHEAAHLAVGRGTAALRGLAQGQGGAEAHLSVVACGVLELDVAHRARQLAEKESSGCLVVPYMGARAHARAEAVHHSLPAHEVARGQAEHRLRAQGGQVEERGLLDDVGVGAPEQRADEVNRCRFEFGQAGNDALGRRPGVGKLLAVVVAHDGGRPRLAVGEAPREEEGERSGLARLDALADGERGHGVVVGRAGQLGQLAVGAEVVPEAQNGVVPVVGRRGGAVRDALGGLRGQGHVAPGRVGRVDALAVHVDAAEAALRAVAVAVFLCAERDEVALPVLREPAAVAPDEITERAAHRHCGRRRARIGHLVRQYGNGQAAGVGVARDKGVKAFHPDGDGQGCVAQLHLPQRVGRAERGVVEAGQSVVVDGASLVVQVLVGVERAGQECCRRPPAVWRDVDGEKRSVVARRDGAVALGRDVHDFPIS